MATKITTRVLADDAVTDAKIADVTLTTATQSASDNTTKIATTAYVTTAIANLSDSAPSTLNTLNELAAALGDDANYATTTTNAIAAKAPLSGATFTGNVGIGIAPRAKLDLKQQTNRTSKTGTARGVLHLQDGDTPANNELTAITFESNSNNASAIIGQSLTNNGSSLFFGTSNSYSSGVTNTAMTINHIGDVGIGISPSNTFSVGASGTVTTRYTSTDTSAFSLLQFENSGSIVLSADHGNNASGSNIIFKSDGATERMRIDSTGRVTFGPDAADIQIDPASTNSGVNLLYFRGNALHDKAEISLNHYGHHNYHMGAGLVGNGKFSIGTSQTDDSFVMDTSGNIGINNDSPAHRLHIQGDTNDLARVRVTNTSSGQASLDLNNSEGYFRTYTDGGEYRIYDQTDGTNRFIIDTSGNVGIGTTGPSKLGITGSSAGKVLELSGDDSQVRIGNSILHHDNSANTYFHIRNHYGATSTAAELSLESGYITLNTGTSFTERWRVNSSGHFTPAQQHTYDIGGTNAEVRNIYAQGISFASSANASGMSSELLDDYEEGTFTPALSNGTYTYSYRRGHYVKIGNLVHIHIGFKLAGASPTSGLGTITGLPFTSTSYGSYQEPHTRIGAGGLLVTANLGIHLTFYKGNGNTSLFARTTSGNIDQPIASNLIWQAGTFIKFNMIYTTA